MFDKIISFSIKNKIVIGFATLALILTGIYSACHLPIDAQPDITNNQVQVITQVPSLGAQEVEQFITAPIELSMANISGVIERRSISRSGISVITLVFKDETDIYWARNQVSAQLKEAESAIPEGIGNPVLAPITTGLGEIYQYVIHPKKGYEDKFTATDLRTLQDWLVRTQLAGTPGLAEVSGWGGYVKQYEIALDNDQLNSLGLTIREIYAALQKNNENTGGSYIEQQKNAYFIRGLGQVKNLDDIRKIVVKNMNGSPVLIRDVAIVQFGTATRYGAVTRNGQGEVVAGVTLMLKGENFSEVIEKVKEKMIQVQKSLPEGIVIEPFIDRTELVGRAIGTVKKNLVEGALIVILVLVLLLGNWRAGLVVASVIPLAMLFAFSLMMLFGVSGNLMSLGAIDFGLIVDGAVIIVEAIIFRLTENKMFPGVLKLNRQQMDAAVYQASAKIRSSAAFGEIIILIVYLPLLALIGIEGKMFKPMAQTVVFAIVGAFILSLTYVPMASALFLSKNTVHRESFPDSCMAFLQRAYRRALTAILEVKKVTVLLVVVLFALSLWAFTNMGGEFIPTLEEGDLTVEISMAQGTSLTEVVNTFGKAEKLLKDKFPEIKQAVTRIGSSEIPTDPMPMERGDMMLSMKPKAEWTSATGRAALMEMMEEELAIIPGINVEISQPMQMRFNELMTGIRQDVAIKIYGNDLDVLTRQANKIAKLIAPVNGVSEPFVEKVNGLPQIQVEYNRDKMAQYGLNISELNMILKTAFAGNVTGVVFEGEKRFDMVVRLNRNLRENISGVENLLIPLTSGHRVPLNQVATIGFKNAPAQISREDGKRRIYVGFNVKDRDVETTVKEIQAKLDQELNLPSGYYITYGGQFQNLQAAKNRLSIAVPAALILILLLLYITFRSVKDSLLIFTTVPLASMGGIAALLLREMPFSISAGVGFIALFGVAVLNGIVLISYFNQLRDEGMTDVYQRILEGTQNRLRPVLMTASVASLGFLPMALSSSAGAEVQRPLATVVIGGLISATFLTLFVLPCLYLMFHRKDKTPFSTSKPLACLIFFGILMFAHPDRLSAQQAARTLGLDSAISLALKNNIRLKSSRLGISQARLLQKSAFDIQKTEVLLTQDPTSGGNMDNSLGIMQNIAWPGFYKNNRRVLHQQFILAEKNNHALEAEITRDLRMAWYSHLLNRETLKVLKFQDSIYNNFVKKAEIRFKAGETTKLELISATAKFQEVLAIKRKAEAALKNSEATIKNLLNIDGSIMVAGENPVIPLQQTADLDVALNVKSQVELQYVEVANARLAMEKSKGMPDFTIGYSQQLLVSGFNPAHVSRTYAPGTRIAGFQVGVALPVFNGAYRSRINAEKLSVDIAKTNLDQVKSQVKLVYDQEFQQYITFSKQAEYYQTTGLKLADEQARIAQVSFNLGEIGYMEFIQHLNTVTQTKLAYIELLGQLNQSAILLQYLKSN